MILIAKQLPDRINFVHLKTIKGESDDSFCDYNHPDGDADTHEIVSILIQEIKPGKENGRTD